MFDRIWGLHHMIRREDDGPFQNPPSHSAIQPTNEKKHRGYAKQVVRDLVRHLDRNLDGTIDSKELNEEEINAAIQRGIAGCAG